MCENCRAKEVLTILPKDQVQPLSYEPNRMLGAEMMPVIEGLRARWGRLSPRFVEQRFAAWKNHLDRASQEWDKAMIVRDYTVDGEWPQELMDHVTAMLGGLIFEFVEFYDLLIGSSDNTSDEAMAEGARIVLEGLPDLENDDEMKMSAARAGVPPEFAEQLSRLARNANWTGMQQDDAGNPDVAGGYL